MDSTLNIQYLNFSPYTCSMNLSTFMKKEKKKKKTRMNSIEIGNYLLLMYNTIVSVYTCQNSCRSDNKAAN